MVKERIVVEPDKAVQDILKTILHQLNLTVSQVLEQHPLLVQIKGDIRHKVETILRDRSFFI